MTRHRFDRVGSARDQVGESPFWDQEADHLYWVDIVGRSIRRFAASSGQTLSWQCEDFPTAIAGRSGSEDAIVAMAQGVCLFDFATGKPAPLCNPDSKEGNRLNEGKCDPQGRFWVGSMQTNLDPGGSPREMTEHSGALFRVDTDGSSMRMSEFEFGISNTMAWSPDGKTFYFGDSLRNVIFAYDWDGQTGGIGERRVLLEGFERGAPDGSCIDADGCLWNARFGGSCLIRITPKGKIDRIVELPVTQPTSCTFWSDKLDHLAITSATFTLSQDQLKANPMEGSMLSFDCGTKGLPDHKFKG